MLTTTTKASSGISIAFPDVCKIMAPPSGVIPIPYPSFAKTALGSQKKTPGGSPMKTPTGSMQGVEAGTSKGGVTSKIKGKAEFIGYSFDVQVEGKSVPGAVTSMMKNNEATQLKSSLDQLNSKLRGMTSKDPNEWQKVLQDYAVAASALYVTLNSDDD